MTLSVRVQLAGVKKVTQKALIKNHEQAAEPLHNNAPSTLSLWKWDSISETSTQACDMEDAKIRRIIACSILMIISGMNKSARHSWIYILTF